MIEETIICDYCKESMEQGETRAEVQVTEYSELHRDGYVIPHFRFLHFHWKCYEEELPSTIKDFDGNA